MDSLLGLPHYKLEGIIYLIYIVSNRLPLDKPFKTYDEALEYAKTTSDMLSDSQESMISLFIYKLIDGVDTVVRRKATGEVITVSSRGTLQ